MSDGPTDRPRIARNWRGRTKRERADEYEAYNYEVGIKPLIQKALGVQCLRDDREAETEFVTISYWESVEAMSRFAGSNPTRSIICHEIPSSSSSCPNVFRFLRSARLTGIPAAACARRPIPHNGGATLVTHSSFVDVAALLVTVLRQTGAALLSVTIATVQELVVPIAAAAGTSGVRKRRAFGRTSAAGARQLQETCTRAAGEKATISFWRSRSDRGSAETRLDIHGDTVSVK